MHVGSVWSVSEGGTEKRKMNLMLLDIWCQQKKKRKKNHQECQPYFLIKRKQKHACSHISKQKNTQTHKAVQVLYWSQLWQIDTVDGQMEKKL